MYFNKESQEVSKSPMSIAMTDSDRQRMMRYATYWQFYLGRHWTHKREEGEPQLTLNYSRAFVDKINTFLFGKGFSVHASNDKVSEVLAPIINRIWKGNNKMLWGIEAGQMGAVSGDLYVKLAWEEPTRSNRLKVGRPRAIILDSCHCFPEFSPHNKEELISFRIAYTYEVPVTGGKKESRVYQEVYTNERFIIVDGNSRTEYENILGFIPIVCIKNLPQAQSSLGVSDLNDFLGLNRELNEKITNISDIINYHQAPITIIYGAKAQSIEKGANKVWAIGSKDARVENLELQGDIGASNTFTTTLKTTMFELMGVPEATLGQQQAISNTSGVALHVQYMPLMEVRSRKMLTYGPGIAAVTRMMIQMDELKRGYRLEEKLAEAGITLGEDEDIYDLVTEFPDPMPKDRLMMLQEIQQRLTMQPLPLITPEDALSMLGIENPKEYIQKIIASIKDIQAQLPSPQPPEDIGGEDINASEDQTGGIAEGTDFAGATNAGGVLQKEMTPSGASQQELTPTYKTEV